MGGWRAFNRSGISSEALISASTIPHYWRKNRWCILSWIKKENKSRLYSTCLILVIILNFSLFYFNHHFGLLVLSKFSFFSSSCLISIIILDFLSYLNFHSFLLHVLFQSSFWTSPCLIYVIILIFFMFYFNQHFGLLLVLFI